MTAPQPAYGQNTESIPGSVLPGVANPPATGNAMAVSGFVLAVSALCLFWALPISFPSWVLGIVFSSIGLSRSNKQGLPHKGLAIAGISVSVTPLAMFVLLVTASRLLG